MRLNRRRWIGGTSVDARRKGEERVIPLLPTIAESTNGPSALTLPILRAVADCMKPAWVEKGLALIEAYDAIDLVALRSTLVDLGLEDQLGRVLHRQLTGSWARTWWLSRCPSRSGSGRQ